MSSIKKSRFMQSLVIVLMIVMIVMAGCSSKSTNTSTEEPTAAATAAATPEASVPVPTISKADLETEITLMGQGNDSEKSIVTKLLASFNKVYPKVKVNYISVPPAEYSQKLTTLIASGNAPDIFYAGGADFYRFVTSDVLLDLQPFLDNTDIFNKDNVWPQALDRYRFDGTNVGAGDLYGIPKDLGPWVLAYNKKLFDEANVPYPPAEPGKWNWNDMIDKATKLTKDTNGDGKTDIYGLGYYTLESAVWANGGDFYDPKAGKVLTDQPAFIEAMQFVADLTLVHKVAPTPDETAAQNPYFRFLDGKVAMFPMGPWDQPGFWPLPFGWDIAPWPASPNTGKTATFVGSLGYGISKKTKSPEAAFALASYLGLDPIGQEEAYKLGQAVPNLKDMTQNGFLKMEQAPANRQVFVDAIDYGRAPLGGDIKDMEWYNTFTSEASKVWSGKETAEKWAKEITPKLQELYDKGNKK
jgi:multiple sugar transport system substrate-binding protein